LPLLFSQLPLPVKAAVMTWLPVVSAEVLKVAMPLPFTATLDASVVAPSLKVTAPVGVPLVDVTVAVKVTDCPNVDGLGAEVTAVDVAPCTICAAAVPLLPAKLVPSVNVAVMLWLPTARFVVLNVATPLALTATAEANVVAPSVNFTVPLGVPVVAVTVAVNVTDCPKLDGFGAELTAVLVAVSTI